jgi:ribosomal protein RSM22 (predicted rRNA methylase)
MADSNWVRFAQRASIDLRSLPYSYLVLEKKSGRQPALAPPLEGWSRIIGRPRMYKGFARVFSCQADGVRELVLQKRDAKPVFRKLDEIGDAPFYQWTVEEDRITSARGLELDGARPETSEAGD